MRYKYNAIISFGVTLVFALLYITGSLTGLENRLYDFFLSFRANRQRINNVVFLDVDDSAIAYNGVYPWPRSIPAEGLLRLKEYNAMAVIFDIEYIDNGPQGVDILYLNQGLGNDFYNSFSEINSAVQDTLSQIKAGKVNINYLDLNSKDLSEFINSQREALLAKAQKVARDNDLYLEQAIALNGNAWSTLNLKAVPLTEPEEADRRPDIAEKLFYYPVNAKENAHTGAGFVDVLTALPRFATASKGAGFTNVEIDTDGVRRRVFLAQNIQDHWYLQLSFAPLIDYLGNPEVLLTKNKLIIKQAAMPDGRVKDINIPLDSKGRLLLDWPKENYEDSYTHISFADFSLLNDLEIELEIYSFALANTGINLFAQFDPSLSDISYIMEDIEYLFNEAHASKEKALLNAHDESFNDYLFYRNQALSLLREIILLDVNEKVSEIALQLSQDYPENAEAYLDEADYINQLVYALTVNLQRFNELNTIHEEKIRNNFVIIGRSDTGSTDYGANPFHPKYINVGTHAVVLDTILSENFLIPLEIWWRIIFMLILIPLLFFATAELAPVKRAISGFAAALLIFIASILLLRFTGIYWGPLGVIAAMVVAVICREIIEYAGSEKEKQFIRTAFSTYLSGDVVKEIISDPSRLQLGGTKRNMTAIFTDVKAFSTISEKLDPEELVSLLNKYLTAMCDIILEEKGTIDKFEGDAIIAFFGAPLDLPDHALRACVSAIRIKKAEEELNKEIMAHKLAPMPLLTRVGVNTGFMVVGNMGTASKMNYTIMGDSVNLAARLEGVNKQYGTWIMASEDTINETDGKLLYRKLDRVRVVGKSEPVRLCEIIDEANLASNEDKKRVDIFHKALEHFENREWQEALAGFKEALAIKSDDEPVKMYLERCEKFITEPPKNDWDGVYNLTSK